MLKHKVNHTVHTVLLTAEHSTASMCTQHRKWIKSYWAQCPVWLFLIQFYIFIPVFLYFDQPITVSAVNQWGHPTTWITWFSIRKYWIRGFFLHRHFPAGQCQGGKLNIRAPSTLGPSSVFDVVEKYNSRKLHDQSQVCRNKMHNSKSGFMCLESYWFSFAEDGGLLLSHPDFVLGHLCLHMSPLWSSLSEPVSHDFLTIKVKFDFAFYSGFVYTASGWLC